MSIRTDRLRKALGDLDRPERPVREWARDVPEWTQRGLWKLLTEAPENRWDIPDGWFRRLFREHEPTEAQALAQEQLTQWLESACARVRPEPLAQQVRAGFEKLPEGQKRALMQFCVERWVAARDQVPIPPAQPEELRPQPRDVGEGEDYEEVL